MTEALELPISYVYRLLSSKLSACSTDSSRGTSVSSICTSASVMPSARLNVMVSSSANALVFGLAGCGGEEQEQAQLQETEYRMTFANQTGRDVSRLEIRPSAESDWQEISLSETEWKSNYEMPIALFWLPSTKVICTCQPSSVSGRNPFSAIGIS